MATPAELFTQNVDKYDLRRHQLQDEQRQQNLALNWGVINNPDASDELKLQARNNIQSLYPSAAHGPLFLNDLKNLVGKVIHHGQQPQASQASPSGDTASTPAGSAPTIQNLAQMLQGAPAQVQPQSTTQAPQVRQVAAAQNPDQALQMIRAYASPIQQQNTLAQQMQEAEARRQIEVGQMAAQNALAQIREKAKYGVGITPENQFLQNFAVEHGFETASEMPLALRTEGLEAFKKANVGPKIQAITVQDANSPTGFSRATFNPLTQETYDVYPGVVPPRGFVPTHRVTTVPGPNGPVTTVSTVTPGLPTAKPFVAPPQGGTQPKPSNAAPVSANAPAGPPTVSPSTPKAMPKKPLSKQPRVAAAKAAARQDKEIPPLRNPALPPMRGADEQRIASVAQPMATVEQQVVGRGVKPLWEYSNVLKNPDLLKTVNYAMAAPMLQTPEGSKSISFWGTVATAMGLSSAAQQATTDAITQARNRVQREGGPEAVEFLDRLAELKGTIPNLRKIQGGSSAMGAIAPLYQESPIMNISSAEDFRHRTANMLRTMAVALNEAPGINKKHVDWLYKQADAAQGKPVSSKVPSGPGSNPVDRFLRNFK